MAAPSSRFEVKNPSRGRVPARAWRTIQDLDDLDLAIVERLQENGRLSNAAIARALGVTETTIRNRIERLIAERFIRVAAVIDPRKTAYRIDVIMWMRLDRRRAREAALRIAEFPNVVYVGHTSGRYDLLVEALFESDEALFEFVTTRLARLRGVARTETYRVLRTRKINYDWKLPLTLPSVNGRNGAARPVRGRGRRARALEMARAALAGGRSLVRS